MIEADERIQPDTVEALVDAVRGFITLEETRESSLQARASGLAGFVGIVLTLIGTIRTSLGDPSCVSLALEGSAVGSLIAALVLVLRYVLLPSRGTIISINEIERYPNPEFIYLERVMAQGRLLKGLIAFLKTERGRNQSKAKWLRRAYVLLGIGLVLIGVDAITSLL